MKKFTILGTGWLGFELAKQLKNKYEVIVSARNDEKLVEYKNLGFNSYILNEYHFSHLDNLLDTNYLFINYPPSKFNDYLQFLEKNIIIRKLRILKKLYLLVQHLFIRIMKVFLMKIILLKFLVINWFLMLRILY